MQGKCHCYLTSRHLRGASCFMGVEDSSGELPSPLLPSPLGLASAFQIPPASSTTGSHSGAPRRAPLSLCCYLHRVGRYPHLTKPLLCYSNQQDLDPVHGLLSPSWSPIPRTASSRMQLLVICLLLQPLPEFQVINLVESRCIPASQRAEVERLSFNNKAAPSTL